MEKSAVQTETRTIFADAIYRNWQGHRRLTRKVIEVFPEDKLFSHSIGGMRTFAELAMEMIGIAAPGVYGMATGKWETSPSMEKPIEEYKPTTKEELLNLWDKVTGEIETYWPQISADRFQQEEVAFGMYPGTILSHLFYFIDNEIHHRGQGYVYLRSLGIEPPFFWDRE